MHHEISKQQEQRKVLVVREGGRERERGRLIPDNGGLSNKGSLQTVAQDHKSSERKFFPT